MWSGVLPATMLWTTFGSGVHGGQKGALGPLGLELPMVGSCQVDVASWIWVLWESSQGSSLLSQSKREKLWGAYFQFIAFGSWMCCYAGITFSLCLSSLWKVREWLRSSGNQPFWWYPPPLEIHILLHLTQEHGVAESRGVSIFSTSGIYQALCVSIQKTKTQTEAKEQR